MQDKILTRINLFKRKVIVDLKGVGYPMYQRSVDFTLHLYITCELVTSLWYMIFRCLM